METDLDKPGAISDQTLPIHVEVWIASRILSRSKEFFTKHDLVMTIHSIFQDDRSGVSTHISSHCVGNKPAYQGTPSNYLYSSSNGVYRAFTGSDTPHPSRIGCRLHPSLEDIPEQFRVLLSDSELSASGAQLSRGRKPKGVRYREKRHPDVAPKGIDISELVLAEREAIDKTLIMMAYNPSCARIFSTDANGNIKGIIYSFIARIDEFDNQDQFDKAHREALEEIVGKVENRKSGKASTKISYGQAQKGLNVFLKVYVDWANLPTLDVAAKVKKFLHCPLDSVVMNYIRIREPGLYKKYQSPPCSMRAIRTYEEYMRWQSICRELVDKCGHPKRTLVDVVWYLESLKPRGARVW